MHILRLDFCSFSAAQICMCCVQQEIPTSDNLFAANSQNKGKSITYKSPCSNLFTCTINHLNTFLCYTPGSAALLLLVGALQYIWNKSSGL